MFKQALKDLGYSFAQFPDLFHGLWHLSRLDHPRVTVFGGKNVASDSVYYQKAKELAFAISKQGFSLITGGGAGIMEAALCGALEGGDARHALGIGVRGVDTTYIPHCKQATMFVSNFSIRKTLMIEYSVAIIVCPGGYGTLDELFQTANLIKVAKIAPVPLILYGAEFWGGLYDWIMRESYERGLISKHRSEIITVVDSQEEVCRILTKHHKPHPRR